MSDPMALREDDVRRIGDYVKPWLRNLVTEVVPPRPTGIDTQLLERMVRVEEELKSQREIMETRFEAADKRFEALDKRFDDMLLHSDKRFEAVDKRFDDMHKSFARTQWVMGLGMALLSAAVTVVGLLG